MKALAAEEDVAKAAVGDDAESVSGRCSHPSPSEVHRPAAKSEHTKVSYQLHRGDAWPCKCSPYKGCGSSPRAWPTTMFDPSTEPLCGPFIFGLGPTRSDDFLLLLLLGD